MKKISSMLLLLMLFTVSGQAEIAEAPTDVFCLAGEARKLYLADVLLPGTAYTVTDTQLTQDGSGFDTWFTGNAPLIWQKIAYVNQKGESREGWIVGNPEAITGVIPLSMADAVYLPQPSEILDIMATYLPGPYGGRSFHENTPFDPIPISPQRFQSDIAALDSPEEAVAYLQGLGLPMDALDCEYVYFYKNRLGVDSFSFTDEKGMAHSLTVLRYSYSEEQNDNFAFIFLESPEGVLLTDCISHFGEITLRQDPQRKNTYLVGKTGDWDYQTIRWYHPFLRETVLAYLYHGMNPDHPVYHIHVSHLEYANNKFEQSGYLILEQFINVEDTNKSPQLMDEPYMCYTTESLVYAVQENGDFVLME